MAEPQDQLRKVMEQRAYTRIGKGASKNGKITAEKIAEVAEVVTTQVRLAHQMGAEVIKTVATAAIREAKNRDKVVKEIEEAAGVEVSVLDEEEEGRLAFMSAASRSATRWRARSPWSTSVAGPRRSSTGRSPSVTEVKSFKIGSGSLAEDHLESDPPSAAESALFATTSRISSMTSSSSSPIRRWRSAGARPPCARWSGRCSSTDARAGGPRPLQRRDRRRRKAPRLDSRRVKLLPAGVLLLEDSRRCSAGRCRSARAASARGSS